jgi:hypothetical protein
MPAGIEMWQDADGRWWWAYVDRGLRIDGNHPYDTRAAAEEGARTAYPEVAMAPVGARRAPSEGRAGILSCVLMTLAIWRHYRPRR